MRVFIFFSLILAQLGLSNIRRSASDQDHTCALRNVLLSFDSSPDGRFLLMGFLEETLLRNLETGAVIKRFLIPGRYVSFSHDGKRMMIVGEHGALLFDTETQADLGLFYSPNELPPSKALITKDDKYIVTYGYQGVTLWDLKTGEKLRHYPLEEDYIDELLAIVSDSGMYAVLPAPKKDPSRPYPYTEYALWNVYTNTKIATFPGVYKFKFLPNDGGLSMLDYKEDRPQIDMLSLPLLKPLAAPIYDADTWEFSVGAAFVAMSSWRSSREGVTILNFSNPNPTPIVLASGTIWSYQYEFVEGGKYVVVFSAEASFATTIVSKWDTTDGRKIKEFKLMGESYYIHEWKFVNDHVILASNSYALTKVDMNVGRVVDIFC